MTPNKPRKLTPRQEASSEDTAPERLRALADDPKFARLVAANPCAPAELLLELSRSDDKAVRKACTSNANTPVEALLKLGSQFPEQLLENPVFGLLLLGHPGLFEELPTSTLNSLLKRDQVPVELIRWAAGSRTKETVGAILMNPGTPEDVVNRLAENCDREASVAAKAHCHYGTLQTQEEFGDNSILLDRDAVITLLSGRQDDFAKSLRKCHRALFCVQAMSRHGELSPEQYMISGHIGIGSGIKWIPSRHKAVILETVFPRWSEHWPSLFDKGIDSLAADERILANKRHGWRRRNYKGRIAEGKPCRIAEGKPCRIAGGEVLPSSQSDLLALSMQHPDHPDITEIVHKLKRTSLLVVVNELRANRLFLHYNRLFCAVVSHPELGEEGRLNLAQMAREKNLWLLAPILEDQHHSCFAPIKDVFMTEVDSWLAKFCAAPRPSSLRLFAFLHKRSLVDMLARNVRSNDWLERFAIASNSSTPIKSLEILSRDGVKYVSRAANASLRMRNA